MLITNNRTTIDVSSLKEIAAGGEGTVYELNVTTALKIYHVPRSKQFANHLGMLSKLGKRFITPGEIWYNTNGEVVGFSMDFVDFNKNILFNRLFKKSFCKSNNIDFNFKLKVLANLKLAIEECHQHDIVIGDLNQYNFFVTSDGDVLFVDVDSFATKEQPHNGVLLNEIRDWTTLSINKMTDIWAYSILIFWMFSFVHPFDFICSTNSDGLETRVRKGLSILSNLSGITIPGVYEKLPDLVEDQFREIFGGRRFFVDFVNQVMQTNIIVKAVNIGSQSLRIQHLASDIISILNAEQFIAFNCQGRSSLWDSRNKGVLLHVLDVDCDSIIPASNGNYAYLRNSELFDMKGKSYSKADISSYVHNSLIRINYDVAEVLDISSQMAGIYKSHTPVFGKSFLKYDNIIQNLGGKKYLVIPVNTSFQVIEIPLGTKNAFSDRDYSILEVVDKGKASFILLHNKTKKQYVMQHYGYFCSKGDVIFFPNDNHIQVIKDGVVITTLDCSICTKDSQLFQTNAGILLLESTNVYLLNTI